MKIKEFSGKSFYKICVDILLEFNYLRLEFILLLHTYIILYKIII